MERYREHRPHPALAPYVDCYWTSVGSGPPRAVLPDGCIDLLFDGARLEVVGAMTRALWVEHRTPARFLAVRFRPGGAIPFVRCPAGALTDHHVEASALLGRDVRALHAQLGEGADPVRTFDAYLLARTAPPVDPRIARAASRLLESPSLAIDTLAGELGLTRQHLGRLFSAHVGVSPKTFARHARLIKLVSCLADRPLARAASDAGYADQAHMTREVRRAVGVPPSTFLRSLARPSPER